MSTYLKCTFKIIIFIVYRIQSLLINNLCLFTYLSKLNDVKNKINNKYNIKYIIIYIYVIKIITLGYDYYIQYKKNICFFYLINN